MFWVSVDTHNSLSPGFVDAGATTTNHETCQALMNWVLSRRDGAQQAPTRLRQRERARYIVCRPIDKIYRS